MAIDTVDSLMFEPSYLPAQPELLVSAVLHLMSHYTVAAQESGCTRLASVIERHLKALAGMQELAPVLRATCTQLSEQWEGLVERSLPQPERFNFFTRFLAGERSAGNV